MRKNKVNKEFELIAILIEEARNRAFHKVNEELVLLYFKIGSIVSEKVSTGSWGEKTVDELAAFIGLNYAGLKGFNRRGLYRMKQFYETYPVPEFVSPLGTQLQTTENDSFKFVTPAVTQLQISESDPLKFVTSLVTQISWTNHLLILSKTKTVEERLFYISACISDKLSKRELERQLNSAVFERTLLVNRKQPTELTQLPGNLLKDPYIFEFLDLPDGHSEKDLEKALVLNLQKFILEGGKVVLANVGNQYACQ